MKGSDPNRLQGHLQECDPNIDDDFFAFVWSTLVQHPSVRVIILAYPVSRADGSIDLGTAPLPQDYIVPSEHGAPSSSSALPAKGRAAAFAAQGDEYRTSKEAISDKREKSLLSKAQKKAEKAKLDGAAKKEHALGEGAQEVYRVVKDVDRVGEPEVAKTNLSGLGGKWGSRLRIRCVDDEIYHRLTGSYQKASLVGSDDIANVDSTGEQDHPSGSACSTTRSSISGEGHHCGRAWAACWFKPRQHVLLHEGPD